jgi:hypothetical protein
LRNLDYSNEVESKKTLEEYAQLKEELDQTMLTWEEALEQLEE